MYTQVQENQARLGGMQLRYMTKPGLAEWQTVTPAAALLAEHASLPQPSQALWLGCGHGAAAAALAQRFPDSQLVLMDTSFVATQMAMLTIQMNRITNARVLQQNSVLPEGQGTFEAVLLNLPKGRKLAQRWLAEAWFALKTGGYLFISGANDQGIQPTLKDASQVFGAAAILDYSKGNRIARLRKSTAETPQAAWLQTPGIAPGTWHSLEIETIQGRLALFSLPGVFSYDQLDAGTALLLEHMSVKQGERVLDLGCGYGIIGLLAFRAGAGQVDLVDENFLAVSAASANMQKYGLDNARVLASDGLSALSGQSYACILSNPPFHAGKGVDYQMAHAFIEKSWQALEPGGRLVLVANRFIRYEQVMRKYFRVVSQQAETDRYHILCGIKS